MSEPPGGTAGRVGARNERRVETTSSTHPRRLTWLLALGVGVFAYVVTFVVMLVTGNSTMLPTVLLVGAATVPITVLLFAQTSRVATMVPGTLVLVTATIGGLVGITLAGIFESIAGAFLGEASVLLVGLIEESSKLVVPLVVLAIAGLARTRGGGVVVGIAAGTGFAVLETMGYGFNALLEKNSAGQVGGLAALDSTLILRGILVPAGHVAWTGAVCAALWAVAEARSEGRKRGWPVLRLVLVYLGAIVLHTLWDASSSMPLHVLIGVVSVGSLLWLTIHAHRAHVRRATPPPRRFLSSSRGTSDPHPSLAE